VPDLRTHRHRVAQWATGTIGTHALRSIIEHPHLELSGVHVFGTGEVGTDAGDLCGLAPPASPPPTVSRRSSTPRPAVRSTCPRPHSTRSGGCGIPGYTANRAVNAVPFVCAAAPGIRATLDLPQIVAELS